MIKILDSNLRNVVIDTSALMNNESIVQEFVDFYRVIISIVTLEELDNLKTNKDFEISKRARSAIKEIEKLKDIIYFDTNKRVHDILLPSSNLMNNFNLNDDIIVTCALFNNAYLITNDFNLKIKAKALGVECFTFIKPESQYKGYREVSVSDEELANLYSNLNNNLFDCLINEYLIINNLNNDFVDILKWNGEKYINIHNKNIATVAFGDKIKPKDIYQRAVIDSIMTNTMTAISGKAGSGKSLLSLMCAMYLVEKGKYDRIVILNNPTKAKGATDCGYYTGSMVEKLMQNSIGNILNTKFGDRLAVDLLLQQDKLRVISMADARGMEIRDSEILYITECQNTSVELLKLSLQRVSQEAKIIIEGDIDAQVDSISFEGNRNGMKRAVEVLKGKPEFGYIELKNIWRSKIAELVEKM